MSEPAGSKVQTLPIASASSCCGTGAEKEQSGSMKDLLSRYNINDYATSVKVFAVKPPVVPHDEDRERGEVNRFGHDKTASRQVLPRDLPGE
jgi:hypothetical protein